MGEEVPNQNEVQLHQPETFNLRNHLAIEEVKPEKSHSTSSGQAKRKLSLSLPVILVSLFILIVTALAIGIIFYNKQTATKIAAINDYESCVSAGNPIMESYPEQCSANGKTFTRELTEEEQKKLDPTSDWKTYEGDGFSFKYPSNYIIENQNSVINIKLDPSTAEKDPSKYFLITISTETLPKNSDLLSFIKSKQYINLGGSNQKVFDNEDIKPYTENNLNGYYWFGGIEYMGYHIYFENDGAVYIFTLNKDEAGIFEEPQKNAANELDQIISTIKFTNPASATDSSTLMN